MFMVLTHFVQQDNLHILTPLHDFWSLNVISRIKSQYKAIHKLQHSHMAAHHITFICTPYHLTLSSSVLKLLHNCFSNNVPLHERGSILVPYSYDQSVYLSWIGNLLLNPCAPL